MIYHSKPPNPKVGDYYTSANGQMFIYDSNSWIPLGMQGPAVSEASVKAIQKLLANPEFDPAPFLVEALAHLLDSATEDHPLRKLIDV
jgi:hypothetical protein